MDRDLSTLFFSYEMYLCGTFLGIIFCIRNYNIHKNKKTIKQLQSHQVGGFLEMPMGMPLISSKKSSITLSLNLKKTNLKTFTNRMTRSKLTFIVYGDMFDIDEFSKIINISPTEFAYKGDKLKFRISTDTFWKYSFKDIISLYVEDSLKPLEKIVTPRIEEISSFMQKNNLKSIMRFKVETNKEPAPAIVFENNIINLLSKLNSSIDLDLYIYD